MEYDVKERNIRDYSITNLTNKPHEYPPFDRRLSKKKADTISKRLHSGNRPSMDRKLKNSKSLRTLNLSENSKGSSDLSAASHSRRRVFSKHRKSSAIAYKIKDKIKIQKRIDKFSKDKKKHIIKKLIPKTSVMTEKEKSVLKK
mmetsp:Transcript_32024/g.28387  ORF Transcript_32024/g.28387 Transcript_32024/m.28387 type:complete len:144 (+) Transcript_32024:599-1030(+)